MPVSWTVSDLDEVCRRLRAPRLEILSLVLLAAFVFLLGRALQALEVGVAYAMWSGIGAEGTLVMGVVLFGEALSGMKVAGIILVMMGITVLRLA